MKSDFHQNVFLGNREVSGLRDDRDSLGYRHIFPGRSPGGALGMNSVSPSISASIINCFSAPPRRGEPLGAAVAALYNNDLDPGDSIFLASV